MPLRSVCLFKYLKIRENHFCTLIYTTDTFYVNQTFPFKHLQKVVRYIKKQCEKGIPESVKKDDSVKKKNALQKN